MQINEHTFRDIIDASPFPVYLCIGEQKTIVVANEATLKAWGKDKTVIGKTFDEALPELLDQPFSGLISEVYKTGESYYGNNERADLLIDGRMQTFYFKYTFQPVRHTDNSIYGVVCFSTDVTELERARQAQESSQHVLNHLIKQAPVGICIINGNDLTVQAANDAYLELVGKNRGQLENRNIWHAIPEAATVYEPILNNVIGSGISYVAKEHDVVLLRNGIEETVYIDFVYEPVQDPDYNINFVMVVAIEVTHNVITRRRIQEAEERARLAIEAAEIGTFDLDLETDNMLTSVRLDKIFGFEHPVPRQVFADAIHPDDLPIRNKAHQDALIKGILFYEVRVVWKDTTEHWIRVQGKTYYNEKNKPNRILGTVLDITEFRRLQQQKDDFISVASHELKTPLTSVKASMQLLDRLLKTNPESDKIPLFVNKANSGLIKMQHLVDSLLNVSKIAAGQLELYKTRFRLTDMITECCDHIRFMGTHEVVLKGDLDLEIYADRERIEQVVVNFVNNAVKYAPDSDKIFVELSREGIMARISVQDFGRGISEDKIPHLFERYYRVDSSGVQYSGLGLGLYISAEIVERHNGQIGVNSEENKGSTFWFTLPIHGRWFY